jgi:hypothetical protein
MYNMGAAISVLIVMKSTEYKDISTIMYEDYFK